MRSSDCGAPGARHDVQPRRLRQRRSPTAARRSRRAVPARRTPSAASRSIVVVLAVADRDERRVGRAASPRDETRARRRPSCAPSACSLPSGVWPYGCVAVQQPDERAIGDRARHVAQLRQPVQPQLPHALEVVLGRATGRAAMSASSVSAGPVKRLSAVTRQQRRVRADVGVELRAEARRAPRASRSPSGRRCPRRACRR